MGIEHALDLSPVTPNVCWQKVDPEDVLSGLVSLRADIRIKTRSVSEQGRGVDITLTWAEEELSLAEQDHVNEGKHASQSIIHAQCAVECLVDTYLERDWLFEKLPDKPALSKKVELLLKRPTLKMPSALLARIVSEPRHDIIHRYHTGTATHARIVFEAASSIISALRSISNPCMQKFFAGSLSGGSGTLIGHVFSGFSGAFGLTWRARSGVVFAATGVPLSKTDVKVYCASLKEFSLEQHLRLLDWWDSLQGNSRSGLNEEILTLADLRAPF